MYCRILQRLWKGFELYYSENKAGLQEANMWLRFSEGKSRQTYWQGYGSNKLRVINIYLEEKIRIETLTEYIHYYLNITLITINYYY